MDETLRYIILNAKLLQQWDNQLTADQLELVKEAGKALLAVVRDIRGERNENPK